MWHLFLRIPKANLLEIQQSWNPFFFTHKNTNFISNIYQLFNFMFLGCIKIFSMLWHNIKKNNYQICNN